MCTTNYIIRAQPLIKRAIVLEIALSASKRLIDSRLYHPRTKSIPRAIYFNQSESISSDVVDYLSCVTKRYQALPSVTKRYKALPCVTMRYQELPTVTKRYQALPSVTNALPSFTKRVSLRSVSKRVTKRYHALLSVCKRFHALPCVTMRYQALPSVVKRYQALPCV